MANFITLDFGWLPTRFDEAIGDLTVTTLPEFDGAVRAVRDSVGVEGDWIYPPLQRRGARMLPYTSRVFGLPKTHRLLHRAAQGKAHGDFLMWAMSFIFGLRLTATEAGFLDATPVKVGKTTDFVLSRPSQVRALNLAEKFWLANTQEPKRAIWWGAAVHALMLGQGPRLLQFEQFFFFYAALDACFAIATDMLGSTNNHLSHAQRIPWMCRAFCMPVPTWALVGAGKKSTVADLRNAVVHESLFQDAPLGFALHGVGTGENLTLEMKCLICRLLVALLGDQTSDYVQSPTDKRQVYLWEPP